ncbi:MAG: hypothetical protein HF982_08995 [Desulfobacteraceae bacterium]|nr:hypothetical protein [Desulfobacteraceae bacterium]MBC2719706.1 hypothetical protein [Desulfobacteraceae bacterium]
METKDRTTASPNLIQKPNNYQRSLARRGSNYTENSEAFVGRLPFEAFQQKIKKKKDKIVLSLQRNQDILKKFGRRKENRLLVGFAAETENLEKNSIDKLVRKNLDIIVGNLVGHSSSGFGSDTNKVTFFYKDGTTESFPEMGKDEIANILLDRIVAMLN